MQRYRIGRSPNSDIVVPEQTISREHAELTDLGDGRFKIKDLGSTYGTAVLQGTDWTTVTEIELERETRVRLGEFETSIAELLRVAEQTVVPGKAAASPLRTAPPAKPAAPAAPAPPPRAAAPPEAPPQQPRPTPRTAAPTEVPAAAPQPPRPARTAAPTEVPAGRQTPQPPRPAPKLSPAPAAPRQPVAAFLRDMPKEKRVLVMLAGGFGVFLLISLITLVLALALG